MSVGGRGEIDAAPACPRAGPGGPCPRARSRRPRRIGAGRRGSGDRAAGPRRHKDPADRDRARGDRFPARRLVRSGRADPAAPPDRGRRRLRGRGGRRAEDPRDRGRLRRASTPTEVQARDLVRRPGAGPAPYARRAPPASGGGWRGPGTPGGRPLGAGREASPRVDRSGGVARAGDLRGGDRERALPCRAMRPRPRGRPGAVHARAGRGGVATLGPRGGPARRVGREARLARAGAPGGPPRRGPRKDARAHDRREQPATGRGGGPAPPGDRRRGVGPGPAPEGADRGRPLARPGLHRVAAAAQRASADRGRAGGSERARRASLARQRARAARRGRDGGDPRPRRGAPPGRSPGVPPRRRRSRGARRALGSSVPHREAQGRRCVREGVPLRSPAAPRRQRHRAAEHAGMLRSALQRLLRKHDLRSVDFRA